MAKAVTIGGAGFWSSVSKPGELYVDGDLMYVVLDYTAKMDIVRRIQPEMFTTTVTAAAKKGYLVIINGLQYTVNVSTYTYIIGDDPVDPSDVQPDGQVVESSRVVSGRSSPQMFYIAQGQAPIFVYYFNSGDPSVSGYYKPLTAMGGLGPIIINDLKYGDGNLYKPGTDGPGTGDPGSAAPNLIQRNNNTYASLNGKGASKGKAVVAQCFAQKKLLVLAQPNGASTGITLDDLRDKLVAAGVENAVFLDGSDSVTFYAQGSIQIAPGKNKDRTIPAGLGFRA
jgi:hypothetical protein